MDFVEFIFGLLGGGLLGIWYAARLRHAEERRGIATVVHAELWVAQWRIKSLIAMLKIQSEILSKYVKEDELRKWAESDEGKRAIDKMKPKVEAALKLLEYAKDYGAKSVFQTDPVRLGYLPPRLALGAAAIYSKVWEITSQVWMFVATFDAETIINLKETVGELNAHVEMLTKMWDSLGPQLLREAGG